MDLLPVMPRTWLALVPTCTDPTPSAPPQTPPSVLPSPRSTTSITGESTCSPVDITSTLLPTARATYSAAKMALDRSSLRPRRSQKRWSLLPLLPAPTVEDFDGPEVTSALGKRSREDFEMRPMQSCDLQAVKSLHESTLPVSYSSSYFLSLLSSPHQICLVATLPSHPLSPSSSHHASSYFDLPSSSHPDASNSPRSPRITSSLSGRTRISRQIVGCVSARVTLPDHAEDELAGAHASTGIRILTLCVDPTYRRTGVASALLDKILSIMTPLARLFDNNKPKSSVVASLHVQAPNVVARRFYERNGFKKVALRPNYYTAMRMKPLEAAMRGSAVDAAWAKKRPAERERDVDAWLLERELA